MSSTEHPYTYGIEEEFFLANTDSRGAVARLPKAFVRECRAQLGDGVQHEMLQSQVEIATPVLTSPAHARDALGELRHGVARVAAAHELALVAAGTHPLGAWREQV
ncbi:MAG TPA: glutamate-cysteine ligase family protein, partial [Rhodanobacteraceae bacterium]|nr:glutamate-cysteine ligase family protein [Rhodanobacteraceae bacterium]